MPSLIFDLCHASAVITKGRGDDETFRLASIVGVRHHYASEIKLEYDALDD